MATVWLTYAWADNTEGDVDFVAQELRGVGLQVMLDRYNLNAGSRLWEQIGDHIQNPSECDAWVIFATQNSLTSEKCKEELAYALDRALEARGNPFPVIGLLPASVDRDLIPPSIRARLYVTLADPDWKERIEAAAEGRGPAIAVGTVEPYFACVHTGAAGSPWSFMIEVRPRAGTWSPFVAAIPLSEKDDVGLEICHGPSGRPPAGPVISISLTDSREGASSDGQWYFSSARNEATPTQSYYVCCNKLPSKLLFGADADLPYVVDPAVLHHT